MNSDIARKAAIGIVTNIAKVIELSDDYSRVALARLIRSVVVRVYPVGTLCKVDRPLMIPLRTSALHGIQNHTLSTIETILIHEDDVLLVVQEPTLAIIKRPGIFIEKGQRVVDLWLEVTTSRFNDRLFVPFDVVSHVRSRRTQR